MTHKESLTIGHRESKKKWEDYLSDEERQAIEDIKNLCLQRMEADKPSVQELQIRKLEAQRDRLLKKIAELQNN